MGDCAAIQVGVLTWREAHDRLKRTTMPTPPLAEFRRRPDGDVRTLQQLPEAGTAQVSGAMGAVRHWRQKRKGALESPHHSLTLTSFL